MFNNFTRRHKLDQPDYDLKHEYIPPAFRFDLYKLLIEDCETIVGEYCIYRDASISINKNNIRFYHAEEIQESYNRDLFVEMLKSAEWHEILSVIEFIVNVETEPIDYNEINELFEYHNVGYRVEKVHPNAEATVIVHYDSLIEDTNRTLELEISYEGVIASIEAAKRALIDPEHIDIANSIKNSVDAIEGYLKGWLKDQGHTNATLGDSIKTIKRLDLCPKQILKALEQFYIFRNMEPNIGHGSPELKPFESEDALLCNEMAVSFINYFFRKT